MLAAVERLMVDWPRVKFASCFLRIGVDPRSVHAVFVVLRAMPLSLPLTALNGLLQLATTVSVSKHGWTIYRPPRLNSASINVNLKKPDSLASTLADRPHLAVGGGGGLHLGREP